MTEVIEKVTRVLGPSPLPFAEGLRWAYEWYLTQPRRAVDYAFDDRVLAGAQGLCVPTRGPSVRSSNHPTLPTVHTEWGSSGRGRSN